MARMTIQLGSDKILVRCSDYLLDANLLVAARVKSHPGHTMATLLLAELLLLRKRGGVRIWVSPLIVSEVWWVLLRLCYDSDNGKGAWNELSRNATSGNSVARGLAKAARSLAVQKYMLSLRQFTSQVLSTEQFDVAAVGSEEIRCSLGHMDSHGIMPHDAFHCSVMQTNSIKGIISNDSDFDAYPGVEQRIAFRI